MGKFLARRRAIAQTSPAPASKALPAMADEELLARIEQLARENPIAKAMPLAMMRKHLEETGSLGPTHRPAIEEILKKFDPGDAAPEVKAISRKESRSEQRIADRRNRSRGT